MLERAIIVENTEVINLAQMKLEVDATSILVKGMFSLSPTKILIIFDSKEDASNAASLDGPLWNVFDDVRVWSEGELFDDRLVCIECIGIHPKCWSMENVRRIGEKWGPVLCIDNKVESLDSLTYTRMLVRTKAQNKIDTRIKLLFEHDSCDVWVKDCYGVRDSCHLDRSEIDKPVTKGAAAEQLTGKHNVNLICPQETCSVDVCPDPFDHLLVRIENQDVWVKEGHGFGDSYHHDRSCHNDEPTKDCTTAEQWTETHNAGLATAEQLAETHNAGLSCSLGNSSVDVRPNPLDPLLVDMMNRIDKQDSWVQEDHGIRDGCQHDKSCEFVDLAMGSVVTEQGTKTLKVGMAAAVHLTETHNVHLFCSLGNSRVDACLVPFDPLLVEMLNRIKEHDEQVWFDPIIVNETAGWLVVIVDGNLDSCGQPAHHCNITLQGVSNQRNLVVDHEKLPSNLFVLGLLLS